MNNKIKRVINGQEVEIELTDSEIRTIFEQKQRLYYLEDVASRYEDDNLTDEQIGKIADLFEQNLEHCDPYFDAYWECMDYTADEVLGR